MFVPKPSWAGGHRMTLYAWARRRQFAELPEPVVRYFDVAVDARVMAHCHWQPNPRERLTIILLHGLEGSSDAHYMRGMADKAWRRGCNVVRLNQRNCGGTEHLSRSLYHSGLTDDPRFVLNELHERDGLPAFAMVGYSLGGNVTLKLAGELGADGFPALKAVAGVSPVIELEACMRAIERRQNRIYEWNFCRNLQGRMRRKAQTIPELFDISGLWKIWSIRQFDDRYTAPHHGFAGASDYYHRASAMRVIDRVARPALIVSAADDPFVPPEIFSAPPVAQNPHIITKVTTHGGHCGFVAEANGYDGYWAEHTAIEFLVNHAAPGAADSPVPRTSSSTAAHVGGSPEYSGR